MTARSPTLTSWLGCRRYPCLLGLLGAVLTSCTVPSTYVLDDVGVDAPRGADRGSLGDLGDDLADAGDVAALDATVDVPSDLGTETSVGDAADGPSLDDQPDGPASPDDGSDVPEPSLDVVCPTGRTRCGDTCVDLANDPSHCGECHNACGPAGQCFVGGCVVDAGGCPTGRSLCGEMCTDTATDPLNCGECGNACGDGFGTCVGGGCITLDAGGCPRGRSLCGETCADTETDPLNCGECGNACGGGTGTCVRGGCSSTVQTCPPGRSLCLDQCVDLNTDPAHCGECSNHCASGRCLAGGCR